MFAAASPACKVRIDSSRSSASCELLRGLPDGGRVCRSELRGACCPRSGDARATAPVPCAIAGGGSTAAAAASLPLVLGMLGRISLTVVSTPPAWLRLKLNLMRGTNCAGPASDAGSCGADARTASLSARTSAEALRCDTGLMLTSRAACDVSLDGLADRAARTALAAAGCMAAGSGRVAGSA